MLDDAKLKALPPRAQTYWRKAQEFVTKNQTDWFIITRRSEQWEAWSSYFDAIGFVPSGMRTCDSFAAPAEFPQWFDGDYRTPDDRHALTEPQRWERYARIMRQRYGENTKLRPRHDWEWGEWANGNVPPAPVPREHVEGSYDAMVKLHGRPIGRFEEGTKWARMAGRQVDLTKSPWKPLTDAQLRDHYKRPEVA
jgi:hypothetical protein